MYYLLIALFVEQIMLFYTVTWFRAKHIDLRITEQPSAHSGIDNLERDKFGKHLLKWNLPETLSNIIPVRRELTIQTIPNAIHTLRPTLGSRAPQGRHFVPIPASSSFLAYYPLPGPFVGVVSEYRNLTNR